MSSLEGFSSRGMELGNDPEGIRKSTINSTQDELIRQYKTSVKILALEKIKNEIIFEGLLGASIRNLSSRGLNVSKENMLKDIEMEVMMQRMGMGLDNNLNSSFQQYGGMNR